jgi:Fe-S-cluster containining protein
MLPTPMPPSPNPTDPPGYSPDQPLLLAVAAAYARYQQQASRWIERFSRQGGTVHCQAGCVHCCNFPVRVSLAEALLTASALTPLQLQAMRLRAIVVVENANTASDWEHYSQRHRQQIGYCPLLDQASGACTAYEVRPARCRDTFSALSSHYCQVNTLERLSRAEQAHYARQVRANPATDGLSHYIAPLEDMGEMIWQVAGQAMRAAWGLEVWGDFWLLTTLGQDPAFMRAVRAGRAKTAIRRARVLGFWHLELVEIGITAGMV